MLGAPPAATGTLLKMQAYYIYNNIYNKASVYLG